MRFTDGGSRTTNGGAGEGTEKVLWDVRLPCDAQAHVRCSGTLKCPGAACARALALQRVIAGQADVADASSGGI